MNIPAAARDLRLENGDNMQHIDGIYASEAAIETSESAQPSVLYKVLPTMVSDRLPTLPSLRRSLGGVRSRGAQSKCSLSTDSSQPKTPPPDYSSRPATGTGTPLEVPLAFEEADFDFLDEPSEQLGSRDTPFVVHEAITGIRWRFVRQGTEPLHLIARSNGAHRG